MYFLFSRSIGDGAQLEGDRGHVCSDQEEPEHIGLVSESTAESRAVEPRLYIFLPFGVFLLIVVIHSFFRKPSYKYPQ